MSPTHSLEKSKEDLSYILKHIEADSNVGIDAPLTHAIIIDYLQNIVQRLEDIEKQLSKGEAA